MTAPALSASQIKSFLACPRKWAWEKIDKVQKLDRPSTALGTRVHEILETWLRDGTPPDLAEVYSYPNPRRPDEQVVRFPGRIAHAGLHLLPPPRAPGLEIEGWLSLRTRATVWTGRLDLRYVDADGTAVVHDHKTTGTSGSRVVLESPLHTPTYSRGPVTLTAETLRKDPQGMLYAASEMVRLGVDRIRLDWLYLPTHKDTNGGKAWKVSLPVLRDEITPDLDRLEDTATLMQRTLASGLTARDIPGNPAACDDYGGCEYLLICDRPQANPFQGFDDMTMTSPDALSAMDALLSRLNGGAPLPPPPPVDVINPPEAPPPTIQAPPPAPVPPPPVVVVPPAGYSTMERKDLKTLAVARGLIEESSKLGKAAIVKLLEDQDGGPVAPIRGLPIEYAQTAVTVPPPAPPGLDAVNKILSQPIPPSPVTPEAPTRPFTADAIALLEAHSNGPYAPPPISQMFSATPVPAPPIPAPPSAADLAGPPPAPIPPTPPAPPMAAPEAPPIAETMNDLAAKVHALDTAEIKRVANATGAPTLTPAHRAFWSEAYLAAARNGHTAPVSAADAALKAMIVRFGGSL